MDYAKGLLRRVKAFEALLEREQTLHGDIELLQIAPLSRSELQPYREFRQELESAAVRINGRFARVDWTPVHYLNRSLARSSLAGLYRASRIGLVTPVRDGMNLVCKEYIAAQDASDPGVLVLSRFAGAAQQMTAALVVNPYDVSEVSDALGRGYRMPLKERRARHEELLDGLLAEDSAWWTRTFVDTLAKTADNRTTKDAGKALA
jgi:trehalose 6-phosphate synthase